MKYILPIACLLLLSSCSSDPSPIGPDGLPAKYSYSVIISCYCSPSYVGPHEIEITDGVITDYEFTGSLQGDEELTPEEYEILSLPNLQQRALDIIDDNPHSQSVVYDTTYNYISSCAFDIDERIADEEWGYQITDFDAK